MSRASGHLLPWSVVASVATAGAGCASTSVVIEPPSPAPVCAPSASALVLWAPRWRADQKDVAAREQAAAAGLSGFFATSGCFARFEVRQVAELPASASTAPSAASPEAFGRLVGIEVRELGPVVKLLSSAALVDGGTEVELRIVDYASQSGSGPRQFTVHWQNGGPGVVKGVATLPDDLRAALAAGLQPAATPR